MSLRSILLSICIAGLALGVDGENMNPIYLIASFVSVALFCGLAIVSQVRKQSGTRTALTLVNSLLIVYIMFSSLITYLWTGDQFGLLSTAPFLLLPLSFAVFRSLPLSTSQWEAIDIDRVCCRAALIFCAVLIAGEPSAFLSSVVGGARFTWTEFRAVNPLPVLAAMLLIWRHGFRAVWRLDFVVLVIYIYSTKYVNWMGLLIISPLLIMMASRFSNAWLSASLVAMIVALNTAVAFYGRDAVRFAPGEFARIYEIQFAYSQFIDNPFFGSGFGKSYSNVVFDDKYSMHNLLAYAISFGGLVGTAILGGAIILYSRLCPGKSEYLTAIYLILTATAASFKLPAVQLYMGLAYAAMAGCAAARRGLRRSEGGAHGV